MNINEWNLNEYLVRRVLNALKNNQKLKNNFKLVADTWKLETWRFSRCLSKKILEVLNDVIRNVLEKM